MSTNLHGQRLPSPSINPITTSFPPTHSYSPITHYSVYEKAINRELSPISSQNSYHHHDYSLPLHTNSPTLTPNSYSRLQNRPPGPAGLDSSPVVSSKARSLSPRPIETATEKDEDFGEFTLASKRALQSGYYLPQKYDNRTSHATRVIYPDNFAYNVSKSNHQGPESYPHTFQNIPSSPLLDPPNTPFHSSYLLNSNIPTISTKDSSPINNNLAQNQIFLRNLENLTEILTDVNKPVSYHPTTKHTEHNYSSIHSIGANQKSNTSYIPSKVNLKIELNNPSQNSFNAINTTKNPPISYEKSTNPATSNPYSLAKRSSLPDRLETAAKDSKTKQGINPSPRKNAAKPIPYLNVQTRTNKTPLKYQESSIHADSKVLSSISAGEKPSSYQAILTNNQKNSARRSARGTAPITKNVKEMASITTTHSRTSSGYNRNSTTSYAERDNVLNYSEMRLGGGGGYGTKGKAYWQIKAVDTKLEENKKNLLNSLLHNNGGISRDSIQTSPYSGISTPGGGHDSNHDRIYPSGNSSFTGGNAPPSRQTIYTNVERSSHTTLDDHHSNVSNGGSRMNTKREVSLESKRGLSGKIYVKAGDEPDKEAQFREDYQELERKLNERLQESKARTHGKVKMAGMRNGNGDESPTRPDPKLFRGRISIKGVEGEVKGTSRSFDLNRAASIKSATFSNFEGEAGRSLSENRSSSKDILKSLKDFGDNVVQSAKDFIQKVGHQRTRTKCACLYTLQGNEDTCPKAQKWLLSKYRKSELGYLKKTYEKIRDSKDLAPACQKQIALDIRRTHPEIEFFAGSGQGVQSLERVLQCYAKYDPKIGYVQGMNFVAASILYHAEEYVAFWILILIFEKAEMRDIYMHNLPGLTKHSQIVDFLILNNIPELYSHFCTHNIVVEMFCTEWICGLFGSVIPLDKMDHFLEEFIAQGWPFFYKFILALLKSFEKELMEAMDMSEILLIFKSGINKREKTMFSGVKVKIDWEKIIKSAHQIQLDTSFIHKLLMRFDQEKKRFVLNSNS